MTVQTWLQKKEEKKKERKKEVKGEKFIFLMVCVRFSQEIRADKDVCACDGKQKEI